MSKSAEKRELILKGAKNVFIRKGFSRVTMKDIIEECAISRGGLYLYFSSTDEIFVEVVKRHNSKKLDEMKESIEKSQDFDRLIDDFFAEQKERLLHMEQSLFAAMLEFCFGHKNTSNRDFYREQFHNTKVIILEMLTFGERQHAFASDDVDRLADSILFLIEGLRSLAVTSPISAELVEKQFRVCKEMIYSRQF